MKDIKKIFVDDFCLPPLENLTVEFNNTHVNCLFVYPGIPPVIVDSFDSFRGKIFIDDKQIKDDNSFNNIKDSFMNLNDEDIFNSTDSFYDYLIEKYVQVNNYLEQYYYKELNKMHFNLDKDLSKKEDEITKATKIYEGNKSLVEEQTEEKLIKLRQQGLNSEDFSIKSQELLAEKEHQFNVLLIAFNKVIDKINDKYSPIISKDQKDKDDAIKQLKDRVKKIYKAKKLKLKYDLKNTNILKKDLYEIFYKETFLPRKEAIKNIDDILISLGFNISYFFKHRQYKKFSLIEKIKLKLAYSILFDKQVYVLNLVNDSFNLNEKKTLINDMNLLLKYKYLGLVITDNVDLLNIFDEESKLFIAIEGKTIEYANIKEITSNPLVPMTQKLIHKEHVSQEDLDIAIDLVGKFNQILDNHYILANETQVIAYKRLLKYQKHVEQKKKQEKVYVSNNVKSKPLLKKKIVKEAIENVVKDVHLEKKIQKLHDENKHNQIKIYLIEKREKDDKWTIRIDSSNKALKLFDTKEQAIKYGKELSYSQVAKLKVQSSKGKSIGQYKEVK